MSPLTGKSMTFLYITSFVFGYPAGDIVVSLSFKVYLRTTDTQIRGKYMRVEQLIGNYTSLRNRQQGKKGPHNPFSVKHGIPRAAVLDIVCLSADDFEQDMDWFGAYVRNLPDEAVMEKIRQIFRTPSDDSLVEKLMFEVF